MKIIHCADLHLDSKMESNFSKEKAAERKKELLLTFTNMVDYANKNSVSLILIAGDLFDTPSNQQITIKKQVAYIISQNPEIDFLYLKGNHDANDFFSTSHTKLENLKTFSNSWMSYKYENVVITGRELSNEKITESLYEELILDPNNVNIVTLHGQVAKATGKDDAPLIDLRKLENKYISYLALGHIHKNSEGKLGNNGVWSYPGCLEGRGFDECGEKGFILLDIQNKEIKRKFIPIAKRTIHEVPVSISGDLDYTEIMNAINDETKAIPETDIVKVILKGEISEETPIQVNAYLQQLEGQFYFIKIYDETTIRIDYEKYNLDVSLKGEFVRCVKADETISEDNKARVILSGLKALAGQEIEL